MSDANEIDRLLADDGPAALVIREPLMPVEGPDGVLFPATFAGSAGNPGGYQIDSLGGDGPKVCLVDSVGSQANRLEPLFMQQRYRKLVPQVVVKAGDRTVNLLEAGHRAGDALMRCTSLQADIREAFTAQLKGDASLLARIAPTSLVFGVWDSRDTQAKLPRLIASTIRAYDVHQLKRSAVYMPPLDYSALEVLSEEDKVKAEGDSGSAAAKRGFVHNPASGAPGGVIARDGVRRDATLQLGALKQLHAGDDAARTLELRRYVLGLALVAFTAPGETYLRQGCTLVRDPDRPYEFVEVHADGRRIPCAISHDQALAFAMKAADGFGIGKDRELEFEKEKAAADLKGDDEKKAKKQAAKKK